MVNATPPRLLSHTHSLTHAHHHIVTALILTPKGAVGTTPLDDAKNAAMLCVIGLPGYVLSMLYIERVGRKRLQMLGFCMMSLLFFICCLAYDWLLDSSEGVSPYRKYVFLLIYALTFLFSNFGPNTTTFVIPGEIYPAEVRATCHGLSAGIRQNTLFLCCLLCFCGLFYYFAVYIVD
jgi:MFS family permease